MRRFAILAALALLAACNDAPEGEPVVTVDLGDGTSAETVPAEAVEEPQDVADAAAPSACNDAEFEGIPLTHCIADPARHAIDTALAPVSGDQAGRIAGWASGVDAATIAFAVNGGMYGDDLRAVGYFVRGGERLGELDTGSGEGNFYIKPNGVFFGSGGKWRILTTEAFLKTVRDRPQFGTQSGPMLVTGGKLPPEISEDGPSRAIRNGVGVDAQGRAHFVMSQEPLSFGQLARYFRDEIKAPEALYLDGAAASNLWDPARGRMDGGRVGPIIVVSKKASP
jgi:uncharacterized protein YigE (DUF2233 family)